MGKNTIGLPPLGEQILKEKYDESEIRKMQEQGKAVILPYRIDLSTKYSRDNVSIKEMVSLDPKTLSPWFSCKAFYGVEKEVIPIVYDAIEMMSKKTGKTIFGSSPDSKPLTINALSIKGRPLSDKVAKYFKEIEAIVILSSTLSK